MVRTNIIPKACYGAQVCGVNKKELTFIRRQAVAGLPPYCKGKSTTKMFLVHSDPTCRVSTAATCRWAKEIWNSANGQRGGALRLTTVRAAWEAIGGLPWKWSTARGPMAVMKLEIERL